MKIYHLIHNSIPTKECITIFQIQDVFYNVDSDNANFKYDFLKKHVITHARLEFDGVNRIDKVAEYFERQQINDYFKTNCKEGIYVYSFSLNPDEYQLFWMYQLSKC